MGDVLEVSFQSRQESHVVLGLHVERAEVLPQVLERVIDAAVDLHEALDSRCLELLVEGAQRRVPLPPVINLRQRPVPLHQQRSAVGRRQTAAHGERAADNWPSGPSSGFAHGTADLQRLSTKSQIPLRYLVRTIFGPAPNQVRTSFEPDSVMEFGFKEILTEFEVKSAVYY